jgi:hypothetical protein
MKTSTYLLTATFAAALLHAPAHAEENPPVEDIISKANQAAYYAGTDGRARVDMKIVDARGGERRRAFTILRRNGENGDQKFYVYFEAPADVRSTAYLVWKAGDPSRDDDRWLWLPGLNLVKRIAPGDKRTQFVGSDFLYEDVSGRHPGADRHELIGEADGRWHIRSTPKNPASVEFAHFEVWIDKATFLPMKAEYTDARGTLYRRVEAKRVEVIQGHPTVMEAEVNDLITGSRTVNTFSDVAYDLGLKDTIFSERFLRRPPREATR